MNKHHLYIALAGLAVGYLAAAQIAQYEPFKTVAVKAGSLAN